MSFEILSEKKIIFIHIPKTAGRSIRNATSEKYKINIIPNDRTLNDNYHSTIKDAENYIGNLDNHLKYTVVRNPWDRLSSWYFFRQNILIKSLKEFDSFGKARKLSYQNRNDIEKEIKSMNQGLYNWFIQYKDRPWDYTWFKPVNNQVDWIRGFEFDKIIKFENLENDFKEIDLLKNIVLSKSNVSKNNQTDYRNVYDTNSKKIVGNFFQEDIDIFKYSF